MTYLCLVFHDERRVRGCTQHELDAIVSARDACRDELRRSGIDIGSGSLAPEGAAVTVRVRGGTMAITEGAIARASECLAGFCLIDARDLNDAIRLASRMPEARLGCVEIHPVAALSAPGHLSMPADAVESRCRPGV